MDGLLQSVSFREGKSCAPATSSRKLIHCHFGLRYSRRRAIGQDQAQLDSAEAGSGALSKLLEQDSIARQQVEAQAALVKQLEGRYRLIARRWPLPSSISATRR